MNFKQLVILFCGIIFFSSLNLKAQTKEDYLTTYDSIISKESLILANGLFHFNNYRVNDNKDIYYNSQHFVKGSLNYLDQIYYDLYLKYDAYNDELIFKPTGKSEKTGINLIKSNISRFKINDLTFVNLDKLNKEGDESIKGFYEERIKNNILSFYIKHSKSKREVFVNKEIFVEFTDESEFILYIDNSFHKINSKNSIIKLFPDKKKIINEYFINNSELKKKDKTLFFNNLFQNISQ